MDKRIGAQLYTIRDFCKNENDFDLSMKKISDIGYKTVQVSGIGDVAPARVKEICDKYSLEIICTHRPFEEYRDDLDKVIDYHSALGCDICGLGSMHHDYLTEDGINEFIKIANRASDTLKKSGFTFAYHNHCFEFMKIKGKYIFDILKDETDIDFIVDVYWLAYAAQNPAAVIEGLGKRAKIVHFKDLAINIMNIEMAEVMEGNLDFDAIINACEKAGVKAAFVEQDICKRNPFESLKISYDNLTAKGFV